MTVPELALCGYSTKNKFNENDPKYYCCCGLHIAKACFVIGEQIYVIY